MDRLNLMTVFVAVAEEEGFAAGARRLNMSPPAVTRAVAALEERLGVKLLNRTTRYVRATDAGQRYLHDARRIIAEADDADDAAAGINAEPRGHLAITAPALFGKMYILPGIVDYLQRYPEMEVSTMFLDRVVNMLEEGMDVGIRIGELPDSSMKALRVGQVHRVICAAPDYLAQHGTPLQPADILAHSLISSSAVGTTHEWGFGHDSDAVNIKIKPRLTVTTNDAAIEASMQGLGITRLMSYQAAPYLASGQLQLILQEFEPAPIPIHVLHREGRYASVKIRSFVDMIAARLRADRTLN